MLSNYDAIMFTNVSRMDRLYGLLSLPVLVSYVYVMFSICYTDII
jgi:hypothetical protein